MPSIQDVTTLALSRRDDEDGSKGLNPIYIAGIVIVGAMLLAVGLWFGIRTMRRRAAKKRDKKSESAFLSVRGVVKESGSGSESSLNEKPQLRVQTANKGFSRGQMHAGIAMPERTLAPRSREEVVNFHRQSGNFPKPFSLAGASPNSPRNSGFLTVPDRLSSAPHSPVTPTGSDGGRAVSWVRHSFMSAFSTNRYSVASSAGGSSYAEPTTGTSRKIRQLFTPVLPDELLVTQLGEQLTVIQSFDDGWCLVGRENHSSFLQKKSLFSKPEAAADPNVELGCVPAWCFLKPVKGLRAERPVRSTSLGVTVQIDAPVESRDNMVSWSNF
ncbi:hypothetical protein FA13DRAFT_1789042 [Coprinellus micaceus]|uniref:SH3 domain-containing protein n=1 Tax=Coprinellus micaceus TaxID=71717 RepID=A0A4Y7TKC0_COPMI|nr:hypothetical protein FA13DRAFT_1789042 [Coprinellus micaceus]